MDLPQSSQLHLWFTRLDEDLYDKNSILLLSADEVKRAQKLKFAVHSKRFITARAALRSILSLYIKISPKDIQFLSSSHGKLFLENTSLQFNLSHSHDLAIYAIAQNAQVGIDLEKIRERYNEAVAKRFFSPTEYSRFTSLSKEEQLPEFYRIWTGKEALVKAQGEGLRFSLANITLPFITDPQTLIIPDSTPSTWYIDNLALFPGYQTTLIADQAFSHFSFWEWTKEGEKKWREDLLRIPA